MNIEALLQRLEPNTQRELIFDARALPDILRDDAANTQGVFLSLHMSMISMTTFLPTTSVPP